MRYRRGFTLVELLVTMAVALILMAGLYQFFVSQQRSYSTQDEVLRLQQEARMAEDLMVKAIQQTGAFAPSLGTTVSLRGQVILAASDHYLTLQYDDPYRDADKGVITAPEIVTYAVSKPSGSATERVGDDPTVAKASRTVRVFFDADGDGEVEASEAFDLAIPLALSGPPYTLYRVTPDDNGTPTFEAVAARVENLVLRYYDHNGNPLPRDPTTGAAVDPPYVLDETERAQVRTIEIELTLRTRNDDPRYSASFVYPAGTVGSYDTSGDPSSTDVTVTDGYRRRTFTTRVSPRNLSANTCGRITVNASPANPQCPASSTVKVNVADQYGDPVAGTTVTLSLPSGSGASFISGGSAVSTTATTDTNGDVSATVYYTGTARVIPVSAQAVVDCRPSGPANFTLIGSVPIEFQPGDPVRVELTEIPHGPAHATYLDTSDASCSAAGSFTFKAQAYDACDNEVDPLPGLSFQTADGTGSAFGSVSPSAFSSTGETFTVQLPASGPYGAPQDASGYFHQFVQAAGTPSWLTGGITATDDQGHTLGFPFSATVRPWPPASLGALSGNIAGTTHTDCPSPAVADTFRVYDCYQNPIYSLGGGYQVTPTLTNDASGPSDQGSVSPTSITTAATPPDYEVTYTPPNCTLGPQAGKQVTPQITLTLENGGTPKATLGPTNLTLEACVDCQLTASPATMTQCSGSTTITVSGCNKDGQPVRLTVSSTGGDASFSSSGIVTQTTVTLSGTAPSTASADLYLGNAQNGDILTVTAEYLDPSTGDVLGTCGPVTIPVSSACVDLRVFPDNTYTTEVGNLPGQVSCISNIDALYFEVEDCQWQPLRLYKAVRVYALADTNGDGNADYLDQEEVDLDPFPATATPPLYFRSVLGLPLQPNPTPTVLDGVLTYPSGKTVQILAAYRDPNDPVGDDYWRNLNAPVPSSFLSSLSSALRQCEKYFTLTVPLPICFPNAVTSGGGGIWHGNFKIHWGDVVVRGDVKLAPTPKFLLKESTAPLNGSPYTGTGNRDRFFDLYVGKNYDGSGGNYIENSGVPVPNSDPSTIDRPFISGGEGASLGTSYGNYFRNLSYEKISEMLRELDYDTMKTLAQDRGVYWYTLPTGQLRNPVTGDVVADLDTLLDMPGPGLPGAYHDGEFIFVDTFGTTTTPPSTTGVDIDSTPLSSLPSFQIRNIYTEGIIYIAGSLDFKGGGGGFNLNVTTPPEYDTRYDHNDPAATFTAGDLPIRPDPAQTQQAVTLSSINVNGGIYLDGEALFSGNPSIFGAITAERGYQGNGTPEIWYNYTLNQSGENESLCIACCTLEISPSAVQVPLGGATTLAAVSAAGTVQWVSENPTVASVDSSGIVTANAIGVTRVKAVDTNNCFAWATVEVTDPCTLMRISPQNPSITTGGTESFSVVNAPVGVSIVWGSSDPTVATIDPATGLATGIGGGTTVITAQDTSGTCPDWTGTVGGFADDETLLTVNCGLAISSAPSSVNVGDDIVLTATGGYGTVTWTPDNPTLVTPGSATGDSATFTADAAGTVTFTAKDSAACEDTVSVEIVSTCPSHTVATTIPSDGAYYGVYTPNGKTLTWRAIPDDNDGSADSLDNIDRLEFVIKDPSGTVIHTQTESQDWYCGFGGNGPCNTKDVSTWAQGTYTLEVTAYTKASHPCGVSTVSDSIQIKVDNSPIEVGRISGLTDSWQTVTFSRPFSDPVVVAKPLSLNDGDPATVRIRNVTSTGFEIRVEEYEYQDGTHGGETVSYLVVARGRHTLPDGTVVEAGTSSAPGDGTWTSVSFASAFPSTPVVATSVITVNEADTVVTRNRNVGTSGFDVRLQEEEALRYNHAAETVAWVAWEPGSGTAWGIRYEVGTTGDSVTDGFTTVSFATSFTGPPFLIADMQTQDGGDTANLRYQNLTATSFQVQVDEEESQNPETNHITEVVGYMAFEP
ncbi:Ig-like domain-containing protein [Deferrisoma camini]|uniref:Ig-like domain-containing protein n=1 Tax=Deferrisoma camini TaxID=1035120 RepID=UPI00046D44F1|nr:Ig-like domain-containing protein [Deferrisoma camini]